MSKLKANSFGLARKANELAKRVSELEADAACDACAGDGKNLNCMCQGTGLASRAVIYLREQLFLTRETLTEALDYMGQLDPMPLNLIAKMEKTLGKNK